MTGEMIERLSPDFTFADERGALVQVASKNIGQVNYIFTKAGVSRGGHYHKLNKEYFYIINGEVQIIGIKDKAQKIYLFKTGDFFVINPFVTHSMIFKEETLMIALYDKGVQQTEGKDIYTD